MKDIDISKSDIITNIKNISLSCSKNSTYINFSIFFKILRENKDKVHSKLDYPEKMLSYIYKNKKNEIFQDQLLRSKYLSTCFTKKNIIFLMDGCLAHTLLIIYRGRKKFVRDPH